MSDRDAPSTDLVVTQLEDPAVRLARVRLAIQSTGSPAEADDWLQMPSRA